MRSIVLSAEGTMESLYSNAIQSASCSLLAQVTDRLDLDVVQAHHLLQQQARARNRDRLRLAHRARASRQQ